MLCIIDFIFNEITFFSKVETLLDVWQGAGMTLSRVSNNKMDYWDYTEDHTSNLVMEDDNSLQVGGYTIEHWEKFNQLICVGKMF